MDLLRDVLVGQFLGGQKTRRKKKRLVQTMYSQLFNVERACEAAGCSVASYYTWYRKDPVFAEKVDSVRDRIVDVAESALLKNVMAGKEQSIMFTLRSKGKHRGWGDSVSVVQTIEPIDVSIVKDEIMEELGHTEGISRA